MTDTDTTSYPFGKGKVSALKVLENNDLPELEEVLGEPEATNIQIKAIVDKVFFLLYGLVECPSMNRGRAKFYHSRPKPPHLKNLPATDENVLLHGLRAHCQMLLWKSADKRNPPQMCSDIKFGWTIEDETVMPTLSSAPIAPDKLLDVVSCNCMAEVKACSPSGCSCHSARLPCTDYCKCEGGVVCFSPFNNQQMEEEDVEEELKVRCGAVG